MNSPSLHHSSTVLTAAALAFINHLLANETWAMARLRPFAGRTARLRCPPFDVCVRIDDTGALRPASNAARESADVSLTLPLDALVARWRPECVQAGDATRAAEFNDDSDLSNPSHPGHSPQPANSGIAGSLGMNSGIFSAARIEGAADLAETLAFVLRNLRWDVEDDLARCVGDIAARRLVQGGRAVCAGASRTAWNLAQNLTEYFSAEKPLIVHRADMAALSRSIESLAADAARLERRLARLDALSRRMTA